MEMYAALFDSRRGSEMSVDPSPEWPDVEKLSTTAPHCLWVKITQLLGEATCYLMPLHDGLHCSVDWMEWT
jgi:hypothetical protein